MSDEEFDDDDLPSITVVASVSRESSWSMPSAGELASEREREQRNEDELFALRQQTPVVCALPLVTLTHSDSSGSESEAALAAAVSAMRMRVQDDRSSQATLSAISLLKESMPLEPTRIEEDYLQALQGPRQQLEIFTEKIVVAVASSSDPASWNPAERMQIARILCAAVLAHSRPRARRALHHILDGCTVIELMELSKRGGITLADAVRGGGQGGEKLAALILKRELTTIADGRPDETDRMLTAEEIAALLSRCSGLSAKTQMSAVLLAGRALSVAGLHEAPLRAPPRSGSLDPDHLRLALAAAKLQLLFREDGLSSELK